MKLPANSKTDDNGRLDDGKIRWGNSHSVPWPTQFSRLRLAGSWKRKPNCSKEMGSALTFGSDSQRVCSKRLDVILQLTKEIYKHVIKINFIYAYIVWSKQVYIIRNIIILRISQSRVSDFLVVLPLKGTVSRVFSQKGIPSNEQKSWKPAEVRDFLLRPRSVQFDQQERHRN
jgi:hypothetical protein